MTAFLLVPGTFTGGWIWDQVGELLGKSGSSAHAVTLTGLGASADPAGADTDLTTHIEDLVRIIDGLDPAETEVVLVGHDYGILPVLGAAALRPDRVTRIVNVDAGLPREGEPALVIEPDQAVREQAVSLASDPSDGPGSRVVRPPSAEEWRQRAGSADLSAEAVEELARRAVPQPHGHPRAALAAAGGGRAHPGDGRPLLGERIEHRTRRVPRRHGRTPGHDADPPRRHPLRTPHRALADALRSGRARRRAAARGGR